MNKIIGIILLSSLAISTVCAEILTQENKSKTYTLNIDKPLNLEFLFKSQKDNCSVDFTIRNDNDELLVKDRHEMKKAKEVFNLSVKEGNYYLELFTYPSCLNKNFELEVIKTSGNFEQEINDNIQTATPIVESKVYTGLLQKRTNGTKGKDFDYYKIDVKEKGKIKLVLKHELFNNREYFYVRVFNYNNEKLAEYTSNLNKRGIEKNIDLDEGQYFVEISTFTHASEVRNIKYNLSYTLIK